MSIQTELSRIINAKSAIKAAIEGKGVTVPEATLLDGMASLIESIEAGGGKYPVSWIKDVSAGTITPSKDVRTLNINVGGELSVLTGLILGVRSGNIPSSYIKSVYFINVNQISGKSTVSGLIYGSSNGSITVSVSNGNISLRSGESCSFRSGVKYAYVAIWRS